MSQMQEKAKTQTAVENPEAKQDESKKPAKDQDPKSKTSNQDTQKAGKEDDKKLKKPSKSVREPRRYYNNDDYYADMQFRYDEEDRFGGATQGMVVTGEGDIVYHSGDYDHTACSSECGYCGYCDY